MKRRPLGILEPAPLLAAAGLFVASVGVGDAESRLAVPLLGSLGLLITVMVGWLHRDREAGRYLLSLMLLGAAVRFAVLGMIHQSVGPYVFAPDQFSYEQYGDGIVLSWIADRPFPAKLAGSLQVGYPLINAILFFMFGPARAAPSVLNIFFSVWTAVPVYHMTRLMVRGRHDIARWAAGLVVFFPSLVLWSVLNVREAPTILVVTSCVYFFVRFQERFGLWDLLGAATTLALLSLFREYLTVLVGLAAGTGILMGRSRYPVRSMVVGSLLLLSLTFVAQTAGVGGTLATEPTLETVQFLRQDLTLGAGSAYGESADISTLTGAVAFVPVGLTYFLLAPFPWSLSSALQAITLPETLVWYTLFPFVLWGALLAVRHDPRSYTVLAAVLVVVTFAYSMVEGNVGTAYRHRAQILPLAFVLCAVGLRDVWALWARRREALLQRRRTVARRVEALRVPGPRQR